MNIRNSIGRLLLSGLWSLVLFLTVHAVKAQSGYVTVEIRVDEVNVLKDSETGLRGTNDYRFDFWINQKDYELQLEVNNVSDNDFPATKKFSDNNTLSEYFSYGTEFLLAMEAWEEDCGEDNVYNSCDDIYCKKEYIVPYTGTEPGVWHRVLDNGNPFWCPGQYSAIVYFRWTAPVPPRPEIPAGKICQGEKEVQFLVPDHLQKQHVAAWEWEKVYVAEECLPATPPCHECYLIADNMERNACLQSCGQISCSNVVTPYEKYVTSTDQLSYAAASEGTEQIRYRQKFNSGSYSPWSPVVSKTYADYYYTVTEAAQLKTYINGAEAGETNLFCGGQSVELRAVHPTGGSWQNHSFLWYRKTGESPFTHLGTTNSHIFTDQGSAYYTEENIQYGVITKRKECSKTFSDTVKSATVFFYEAVPDLSPYALTSAASCEQASDGKVTIKASSSNTDKFYYYNLALEDNTQPDGIDRSTILSSERWPASRDFIFPDDVKGLPQSYGGLQAGRYRVQVINGSHTYSSEGTFASEGYCYQNFAAEIKVAPPLVITTFSPYKEVSCYQGNDGEIKLAYTGGIAPFRIEVYKGATADFSIQNAQPLKTFNSSSNSLMVEGLSAGYYKISIAHAEGACTVLSGGAVFVNEPAKLTLKDISMSHYGGSDPQVSCYGATDATLTIRPAGGNQQKEYIAILQKNGVVYRKNVAFHEKTTFTGLGPGRYQVEVRNACNPSQLSAAGPFEIKEPQLLKINWLHTRQISCYGLPDGAVTVSASGGTANRQFRINKSEWQTMVDEQQEFTFSQLDSGWHMVEVQDINQCTAAEALSFHLSYPTALTFTTDTLRMPLCHGGTDGAIVVRPAGGAYDSTGFATENYRVRLSSPHMDTAIVVSRGRQAVFEQLSSATYYITIEDADPAHACAADAVPVFLPEPAPVEIQVTDMHMPSCQGSEDGMIRVQAHGGTPGENPDYYYSIDGIHYQKPDQQGRATFSGLKAGNYTLYAIDGHHEDYSNPAFLGIASVNKRCAGTLEYTLPEPELIHIAVKAQPVVCYGTASGSIVVDSIYGGKGAYTYHWEAYDQISKRYYPFAPGEPLHVQHLKAGSYKLTVFDGEGCRATAAVEVTQPQMALSVANIQMYAVSCTGRADGRLQVTADGGYPPYQYQLNQQPSQTYGFFEGLSEGIYTLTVKDGMGCEVSRQVSVTVQQLKVDIIESTAATAGEKDGRLRLQVTGGGNKTYYLDGILNSSGPEFNELAAGTHTVGIHYNNGCFWDTTFHIAEAGARVASLRVMTKSLQPVSCSSAQDGRATVEATGGIAPYHFQWHDSLSQTGATASHLRKGTCRLTVTDAQGNTQEHTVVIDGPEALQVVHTLGMAPTCFQGEDGQAAITVTGGTPPYRYQWSDSRQQTTRIATQLSAGIYTVTVEDSKGCHVSGEIEVKEKSPPANIIEAEHITLCAGQSVEITAGTQWAYCKWYSEHGFQSEQTEVSLSEAGIYYVKVTDTNGCETTDTLHIEVSEHVVQAQFLLPTEVAAGDTVALTELSWPVPEHINWLYSENVIRYKSEGEKEYVIFSEAGEYTIGLQVSVGNCTDVIEKKITVENAALAGKAENARLAAEDALLFTLFPNPSEGVFFVKVHLPKPLPVQISVYDPLFSYRYYTKNFSETDVLEEQIDLSFLKKGTYHLLISTGSELKVLRFIIY